MYVICYDDAIQENTRKRAPNMLHDFMSAHSLGSSSVFAETMLVGIYAHTGKRILSSRLNANERVQTFSRFERRRIPHTSNNVLPYNFYGMVSCCKGQIAHMQRKTYAATRLPFEHTHTESIINMHTDTVANQTPNRARVLV